MDNDTKGMICANNQQQKERLERKRWNSDANTKHMTEEMTKAYIFFFIVNEKAHGKAHEKAHDKRM